MELNRDFLAEKGRLELRLVQIGDELTEREQPKEQEDLMEKARELLQLDTLPRELAVALIEKSRLEKLIRIPANRKSKSHGNSEDLGTMTTVWCRLSPAFQKCPNVSSPMCSSQPTRSRASAMSI